jgi:short-subunit dehydrogenase
VRKTRTSLAGKICLITGAGSGIGKAVALVAAGRGARLILTSQTPAKLEASVAEIDAKHGEILYSEALDITNYEVVKTFSETIVEKFGSVDVLVNVAGVSLWGQAERLEYRHWRKAIDVNLLGTIHLIENFTPTMVAAKRGGHIVNVSSAAGLLGLPLHAAYSASKYGIVGLTDVLYVDLKQHEIDVTLVCPGAVRTPIMDSTEVIGTNDELRARFRKLFSMIAIPPNRAAETIVKGIEKRKYMVYTNADIRLLYFIKANTPFLYRWMMIVLARFMRRYLVTEGAV